MYLRTKHVQNSPWVCPAASRRCPRRAARSGVRAAGQRKRRMPRPPTANPFAAWPDFAGPPDTGVYRRVIRCRPVRWRLDRNATAAGTTCLADDAALRRSRAGAALALAVAALASGGTVELCGLCGALRWIPLPPASQQPTVEVSRCGLWLWCEKIAARGVRASAASGQRSVNLAGTSAPH